MSNEQTANEIAKTLGESDERPVSQIVSVIEIIGADTAQSLLDRTFEIEKAGGLPRSDGTGRRTPGGVFFKLAREHLNRKQRIAIFGEPPRPPKKPKRTPEPTPKARPRPRVVEVAAIGKSSRSKWGGGGPDSRRGFALSDRSAQQAQAARLIVPDVPGSSPQQVSLAVLRTQVREQIAEALEPMPPVERYHLLLDLLAGIHSRMGAPESVKTSRVSLDSDSDSDSAEAEADPDSATASTAKPESEPPSSDLIPPPTQRTAAEVEEADGPGKTLRETVLDEIKSKPGVSVAELAEHAYGENNEVNRKRVQALIFNLKKAGKVRSAGRGQFEAV